MIKLTKYVLYIFGAIVAFWVIFYILLIFISSDLEFIFPPSMKLTNIGAFGDSFNILTSLFTGLAFAGMAVSIMYQIESVKEQVRDRKQAHDEFIKQNKILKEQQKEFQNQSFDNKFFQMIQLLNSIISRWSIRSFSQEEGKVTILRNHEVFVELKVLLEEKLRLKKTIEDYYQVFNNYNIENDTTMKYFFINLYQILKLIDDKNDVDSIKQNYVDILRAQLSKDVLILLFFNVVGLRNNIGQEYLNLTKKYHFLEEIKEDDLNIEEELSKKLLERYYSKVVVNE